MPKQEHFRIVLSKTRTEVARSLKALFHDVVNLMPLVQKSNEIHDLLAAFHNVPSEGVTKLLGMVEAYGMQGWVEFLSALETTNLNEIRKLFVEAEELKGKSFSLTTKRRAI